jgi:hypothetical protein
LHKFQRKPAKQNFCWRNRKTKHSQAHLHNAGVATAEPQRRARCRAGGGRPTQDGGDGGRPRADPVPSGGEEGEEEERRRRRHGEGRLTNREGTSHRPLVREAAGRSARSVRSPPGCRSSQFVAYFGVSLSLPRCPHPLSNQDSGFAPESVATIT